MRKPYILERHRIKKSQSDRRDAIEKAIHERGQAITYEEEGDDNELDDTQDIAGA